MIVQDKDDKVKKKIVGFLALSVYWRDMIRGILPPGANVIVVLCSVVSVVVCDIRELWRVLLLLCRSSSKGLRMASSFQDE